MTIYALSSGRGRAGVAVIRLSGPEAGAALERLTGRRRPPPRRAVLRRFLRPEGGEVIDRGLALWLPGPASATGEDMAELHCHGGAAVVAALLDAVGAIPGLRPAEPGEFTRRAFENGRLDLTQAEAVADLVAAASEAQRRQALRQMEGELGALYERWRGRLLAALAHLEAAIDFADDDLPEGVAAAVRPVLAEVRGEIAAHLADGHRGERLREGCYVAVLGAPNVGKSSLVNRLARREAAIVSARAGTTRDVVEVHLDLGGFPVVVADTAGLREGGDEIEAEGVRRARARAGSADLKLAMVEATAWPEVDAGTAALIDADTLVVVNKIDLAPLPADACWQGRPVYPLSARSGEGSEALIAALESEVAARLAPGAAPALTRARHRRALENCLAALARAEGAGESELHAEDVRLAMRALGRITGRVDVEDILDIVFSEFCIGK